jgi:hypothetical protein
MRWFYSPSGFSESVIEGVLEADEFPDQGIVAAVGLVALMCQEVIEIEFGVDVVLWVGFHKPRLSQARARHADETRGDSPAVFAMITQALLNALGTRQVGNQIFLV